MGYMKPKVYRVYKEGFPCAPRLLWRRHRAKNTQTRPFMLLTAGTEEHTFQMFPSYFYLRLCINHTGVPVAWHVQERQSALIALPTVYELLATTRENANVSSITSEWLGHPEVVVTCQLC